MSCRRVQPLVALWVGGDLAPRRARRVEAHIAHCEACRLLAERLRATRVALAVLAEEAPDRAALQLVRQRVLAALAHPPAGAASSRALAWFPSVAWKGALGAALLAIVAAALVLVQRAANRPETPMGTAALSSARPSEAIPPPTRPPQRLEEPPAVRQRVASGVPGESPQRRPRVARPSPQAREAAAEPFVIKIVTDDPDVVIYWFVDGEKG